MVGLESPRVHFWQPSCAEKEGSDKRTICDKDKIA